MYVFSFFPPFKPSSFLFWLLPSSPLSFLYFLTLSGLVSCVTGNVTVSVFFPPLVITATLSFLLYSLHYSFLQFFFLLWFALPLLSCRPNVSPHVSLTLHLVCAVTSYIREVTAQSSVCTATVKTPHTASSALKKFLTFCKRVFFSALRK